MGLKRLITNLMGRTIPERIVKRLDNSRKTGIKYRGGRLSRRREGGILWTGCGYERLYDKVGSRLILESFHDIHRKRDNLTAGLN